MTRCTGDSTRARLEVVLALISLENDGIEDLIFLSETPFLANEDRKGVEAVLTGVDLNHECIFTPTAILFVPTMRKITFRVSA